MKLAIIDTWALTSPDFASTIALDADDLPQLTVWAGHLLAEAPALIADLERDDWTIWLLGRARTFGGRAELQRWFRHQLLTHADLQWLPLSLSVHYSREGDGIEHGSGIARANDPEFSLDMQEFDDNCRQVAGKERLETILVCTGDAALERTITQNLHSRTIVTRTIAEAHAVVRVHSQQSAERRAAAVHHQVRITELAQTVSPDRNVIIVCSQTVYSLTALTPLFTQSPHPVAVVYSDRTIEGMGNSSFYSLTHSDQRGNTNGWAYVYAVADAVCRGVGPRTIVVFGAWFHFVEVLNALALRMIHPPLRWIVIVDDFQEALTVPLDDPVIVGIGIGLPPDASRVGAGLVLHTTVSISTDWRNPLDGGYQTHSAQIDAANTQLRQVLWVPASDTFTPT